ncbi:tyrosine-type recombinase/integrase [Sphingomonas bacterium]|uniref:tyrosine-type recombinase/integrase n=1 Tax=Sphingomonas bacterium TaxID=1895847 RepID=UPI001C2D92B3|nr:integrase family protein [Sphingomonas bacterium]
MTTHIIESAKVPSEGQTFLWDGELKGFGVRVGSTGVKSYVLQYRNPDGRLRRSAYARFPVFNVDQGRKEAIRMLADITRGIDPADEKEAKRAAPTIGDVCDWYLEEAEAGRLLGRRRLPIKASTVRMERSRINRHIRPLIGHRKVTCLKPADIESMQADIAAGKSAADKGKGRGRSTTGGNGAASRVISTLHSMCEHAVRLGIIGSNPAKGARRMASSCRTRRLSAIELGKLGTVMQLAATRDENPTGLAAVRLIALTCFRLSEAQEVERTWVDSEGSAVHFPDTKSGAQDRPVGKAALAVLGAQPEMAGCPFVFPSDYGDSHYKQVPEVLQRLCIAARIEGVTAHTLRHTFSSVAGDMGYSELTIAALLGHGKRGVTQGYIHIEEGLREAADRVAAKIADLLDGRASNVRDDKKPTSNSRSAPNRYAA